MSFSRGLARLFLVIFVVTPCLSVSGASKSSSIMPKTRTITIQPITHDVIDIRPGGLVKIIFPWVLNEDDDELPYFGRLATDNVFALEKKAGQNVLVLYYKNISPNLEGEMVDLTVSTRGYHFTFTVRANFDPRKHYSNIVLKLTEADKIELLDREKKRFLDQLAQERSRLIEEIDARAEQRALRLIGELSDSDPDVSRIKEENELTFSNGDRAIAFVNVARHWDKFTVFEFEIENDSEKTPLYVQSVQLFEVNDGGGKKPINVVHDLSPKLAPNEIAKGTFATLAKVPEENVLLEVTTDRGNIEVSW